MSRGSPTISPLINVSEWQAAITSYSTYARLISFGGSKMNGTLILDEDFLNFSSLDIKVWSTLVESESLSLGQSTIFSKKSIKFGFEAFSSE
jgi:hypothetical protein